MSKQLTPEKWAELKSLYGDNAYLMTEMERAEFNALGRFLSSEWMTPISNEAVEHDGHYYEVRIKESAALPFDLERANNDDTVQCFNHRKNIFEDVIFLGGTGILEVKFSDNTYRYVKAEELRMKYPTKVKQ
jgi:hypothetical protein